MNRDTHHTWFWHIMAYLEVMQAQVQPITMIIYINGSAQDYSSSSASTMELLRSCTHISTFGRPNLKFDPGSPQAITWANADQDFCRHMASLGPSELINLKSIVTQCISSKVTAVFY